MSEENNNSFTFLPLADRPTSLSLTVRELIQKVRAGKVYCKQGTKPLVGLVISLQAVPALCLSIVEGDAEERGTISFLRERQHEWIA